MVWQSILMNIAVGVVVSVITGLAHHYMTRCARRQEEAQHGYEENELRPQNNISCPMCGGRLDRDDQSRLQCGHRCHETCRRRLQRRNLGCSFCNDEAEIVWPEDNERHELRRRRRRISDELAVDNNQLDEAAQNDRATGAPIIKCGYCEIPIESLLMMQKTRLKCGHWGHRECAKFDRTSFAKCAECPQGDTSSANASV